MFCAFFADSALVFNIWLSVKEALPQFCLKSYFETAPFLWGCGLLQRTNASPTAEHSHVCRPRGVFSDVHAAGKNEFDFFRGCGRELRETGAHGSWQRTARCALPWGRIC
jgi:hypothetical protein